MRAQHMRSSFHAQCSNCRRPVVPGQRISQVVGGWVHRTCGKAKYPE